MEIQKIDEFLQKQVEVFLRFFRVRNPMAENELLPLKENEILRTSPTFRDTILVAKILDMDKKLDKIINELERRKN